MDAFKVLEAAKNSGEEKRGLAIIYDGYNLVGNRIDIRDFRSGRPV